MDGDMLGAGLIIVLFGLLIAGIDFVFPLGVSFLGLALLITGGLLFTAGFFVPPRPKIEPQPGCEFCPFCSEEIPQASPVCPVCDTKRLSKLEE